jgi:alpha-galactosidase
VEASHIQLLESCAESCERIDDEMMHECARVCRECAESCQRVSRGPTRMAG